MCFRCQLLQFVSDLICPLFYLRVIRLMVSVSHTGIHVALSSVYTVYYVKNKDIHSIRSGAVMSYFKNEGSNNNSARLADVAPIADRMRLRWYGHILHVKEDSVHKKGLELEE